MYQKTKEKNKQKPKNAASWHTLDGRSVCLPGATDTHVEMSRLEVIPYTTKAANQLTDGKSTETKL